jgi:Spy/CpxP family protein refolding chaperone
MRGIVRSLALSGALWLAATPGGAQGKPGDDAYARALFDPQLVLRHARDIGLTPEQRRTILDEIKRAQTDLTPFQTDMTEPSLDLMELLEQPKVDEAAVVAKTDQVLKIENEVKKRQIAMLVRIKNVLTREQQSRLRTLRDAGGGGSGGDAPTESREGLGGSS